MTPAPQGVRAYVRRPRQRAGLLELFVLGEIFYQLAPVTPSLAAFVWFWRTAPFAMSLALLALLPGCGRLHPATKSALCAFGIVAFPLNPGGVSFMAAGAQFATILGPLFWVSRVHIDQQMMRRVLLIVWEFQLRWL